MTIERVLTLLPVISFLAIAAYKLYSLYKERLDKITIALDTKASTEDLTVFKNEFHDYVKTSNQRHDETMEYLLEISKDIGYLKGIRN
jgi:hypothetical protein